MNDKRVIKRMLLLMLLLSAGHYAEQIFQHRLHAKQVKKAGNLQFTHKTKLCYGKFR